MSCNAKELKPKEIRKLIGLLKAKKYILYSKPYQLNIVSSRTADSKPEYFDDVMNVFWQTDDKKWVGKQYKITTDPSTNYLKKGGIGTFKGKKGHSYITSWSIC